MLVLGLIGVHLLLEECGCGYWSPFECIRVPLCALGAEPWSLVGGALKEGLVVLDLPFGTH